MTTVQQQEAAILRNQSRIIDLLKWSLAIYSAFQYDMGLKYLEQYFGEHDAAGARKIESMKEYWSWWRTLFNARDEAFVHDWDGTEYSIPIEDLRVMYKDLHNPDVLACEIKPPAILFGKDFVKIEMVTV